MAEGYSGKLHAKPRQCRQSTSSHMERNTEARRAAVTAQHFKNFWEPLGVPKEEGYYAIETDSVYLCHHVPEFYVDEKPVQWCGSTILVETLIVGGYNLFPFQSDDSVAGLDEESSGPLGVPRICCGCSFRDFFHCLETLVSCVDCSKEMDLSLFYIYIECFPAVTDPSDEVFNGFLTGDNTNVQALKDHFEFAFGFTFDENESVDDRQRRENEYRTKIRNAHPNYDFVMFGTAEVWKRSLKNFSNKKEKCIAPECTRSLKGHVPSLISGLRHFIDFESAHKPLCKIDLELPGGKFENRLAKIEMCNSTKFRQLVFVKISLNHISTMFVFGKTFLQSVKGAADFVPSYVLTGNILSADAVNFTGLFASQLLERIVNIHDKSSNNLLSLQNLSKHLVVKTIVTRCVKQDKNVICENFVSHIQKTMEEYFHHFLALELTSWCKELLSIMCLNIDALVHRYNVDEKVRNVSFRKCGKCASCKNV